MIQTKAEQWRQTILTFESKKTYENPFLDVSIWAVFEGPSGRRIKREAYWDGENRYRSHSHRRRPESGITCWRHRRRQDFPA